MAAPAAIRSCFLDQYTDLFVTDRTPTSSVPTPSLDRTVTIRYLTTLCYCTGGKGQKYRCLLSQTQYYGTVVLSLQPGLRDQWPGFWKARAQPGTNLKD
eukprot:450616-Hanusia_phi.AAC.1